MVEVYKEENGASQLPMQLCYVALRVPLQLIQTDMMKEPNSKFQAYEQLSQSNWNTSFPWQPWPSQPENQSWQRGWEVTYGNHP